MAVSVVAGAGAVTLAGAFYGHHVDDSAAKGGVVLPQSRAMNLLAADQPLFSPATWIPSPTPPTGRGATPAEAAAAYAGAFAWANPFNYPVPFMFPGVPPGVPGSPTTLLTLGLIGPGGLLIGDRR